MSALLPRCLGSWSPCSLCTPGKQVSFVSSPLLGPFLISSSFPSLSPHETMCPSDLQQTVYFFSAWYCTWDAVGAQIFEGCWNEWFSFLACYIIVLVPLLVSLQWEQTCTDHSSMNKSLVCNQDQWYSQRWYHHSKKETPLVTARVLGILKPPETKCIRITPIYFWWIALI